MVLKAAMRRQWRCWRQGEGRFSKGGLEDVVVVAAKAAARRQGDNEGALAWVGRRRQLQQRWLG